jgi:hypothetical protein
MSRYKGRTDPKEIEKAFPHIVEMIVSVSALFLILATAASIPSVVLLRRLRIRRAKSLVEIATRFRGDFGRYGVTMAVLHSIRPGHQTNSNLPTALL